MTINQQKDNVVLVGKKPIMNYVVACLTIFDSGIFSVSVKARGIAISRAVDAVELLRRAFIKGLKIDEITIGTQEYMNRNGINSSTSTIEIIISNPRIAKLKEKK